MINFKILEAGVRWGVELLMQAVPPVHVVHRDNTTSGNGAEVENVDPGFQHQLAPHRFGYCTDTGAEVGNVGSVIPIPAGITPWRILLYSFWDGPRSNNKLKYLQSQDPMVSVQRACGSQARFLGFALTPSLHSLMLSQALASLESLYPASQVQLASCP